MQLFVREHGRLVPTAEARRIAEEAQHLFMQQKRINSIVDELRGGVIGRLGIVATPSIGLGILPHVLADFSRHRPKLNLELELGSIDEIQDRLISGRSDLGLTITQPRHPLLNVHTLAHGRMVLVCPVDHELAAAERVEVTALNRYNHISYGGDTPLGRAIDHVFGENGLERRFCTQVRHTAVALELVAHGLGVALVDEFALADPRVRGVVSKPTIPELPINLYAVTSNLFPVSQVARTFQSDLEAFLASNAGG